MTNLKVEFRKWGTVVLRDLLHANMLCPPDEFELRQRKLLYSLADAFVEISGLLIKEEEKPMDKEIKKAKKGIDKKMDKLASMDKKQDKKMEKCEDKVMKKKK